VAPAARSAGIGKLLVTKGRRLYDKYRSTKGIDQPPVRFCLVSTGLLNHVASALYRKYLLNPMKTFAAGMADVYYGNPEMYLGGEVLPYGDADDE